MPNPMHDHHHPTTPDVGGEDPALQDGDTPPVDGIVDGMVDVVVVGGGAAGLAAALSLSRVRRSVVVIDAGEPRNAPAQHMHGYLSRDGVAPMEFLETARAEVMAYGAEVLHGRAVRASTRADGRFLVELDDGRSVLGRRLLVTSGVVDELPSIPGLAARWGRDVIHCPYCHGWEVQDQAIAVISTGSFGVHQASMFRQLSPHVTLFVHSGTPPTSRERAQLTTRGVVIVDGDVTEVIVDEDRITGIRVASGQVHPADAVVVMSRPVARSAVLATLGLEPVEHPMGFGTYIESGVFGATALPGVYVAGNVTEPTAAVLQCAAAGSMAGAGINNDLIGEDTESAMAAAGQLDPLPVMDQAFWEERYGSAPQVWSGNPNPHLVTDTAELTPGTALDIGAGEGADAIWLAERGWDVTAVDISQIALDRGRTEATARGADVAGRITWVQADVTEWEPPVDTFDLVTLQFMHLPSAQREPLYQRCADAVAPGGVLLIVAHHPSDQETLVRRPRSFDMFFTADELADTLDDSWEVLVRDARPRSATDPSGAAISIHDTVLVARRRAR